MCGLVAYFAYHEAAIPVQSEAVAAVDAVMAPRGPDGHGRWRSPCGRCAMAHRRLAIIDPGETGHQPMRDEEADLCLSFNGEIYNHQALRQELRTQGHRFRGSSDAEVLLAMYRHHGVEALPRLRGMFAFAIWDGRRRELVLARDGYGIKPLYYSDDGWTVRVASQARALVADGRVDGRADPAGWAGFYMFGSVPEPFTTYRGIRSVPAGSVIRVGDLGPGAARRWFRLGDVGAPEEAARPGESLDSALADALRDSVRAHLVSDVPVGLFLSSGVDSATLLALCADLGARDTQTITLGFQEFKGSPRDEVPLARELARRYGFHHQVRRVGEDEFQQDLPRILGAMDQPSIDGVNTWFVSKAAGELGLKVALSGVGADELLGGYPGFVQIPRMVAALRAVSWLPGLRTLGARALAPMLPALGLHPKWAGVPGFGGSVAGAYFLRRALFLPFELPGLMGVDSAREALERLQPEGYLNSLLEPRPRSRFLQIAILESSAYMRNQLLRDCDWAGMAHAVEIRVPFVDAALYRRLAPLLAVDPRVPGKGLLARVPFRSLPRAMLSRAKTGFETPAARWSRARPGQPSGAPMRDWARLVASRLGVAGLAS